MSVRRYGFFDEGIFTEFAFIEEERVERGAVAKKKIYYFVLLDVTLPDRYLTRS